MRKHLNLILAATLTASPLLVLTSCNNNTKLPYTCAINNAKYFAAPVEIGHIYLNQNLTFSFELNSQCYLSYTESYFKVTGHRSYSFTSSNIHITNDGNKYTCTIDDDIIQDGFVIIYLCAYKLFNYDNSQSSKDIQFESSLTSYPIEGESFTMGFKVNNDKALDISKSTIKVNSTALSNDDLYIWDQTIDTTLYTFITIPSDKVKGDISVNLQAAESVTISSVTYPEYSVKCLSKVAKNSDFYMYFVMADGYTLDIDKAIIKIGDVEIKDGYSFNTDSLIPYLKINSDKVKDKISVDVPAIEYFTLYANKPGEYATVEVEGDEVIKGKEYKFIVTPLNGKTIQWEHTSTYISVNDEKLTLNNGFTYALDPETQKIIVTVDADKTIGDLYCHFITL